MLISTYQGISYLFLKSLGSPYQNRFVNLGHYPKFSSESHCKGCERLILNGFEWKVISGIDFLIMVPSAIDHFEQRMRVRNTWAGAPSTYADKKVFFFLGKPLNNTKQKEIAHENSKYGDIVQAGAFKKYNIFFSSLQSYYLYTGHQIFCTKK